MLVHASWEAVECHHHKQMAHVVPAALTSAMNYSCCRLDSLRVVPRQLGVAHLTMKEEGGKSSGSCLSMRAGYCNLTVLFQRMAEPLTTRKYKQSPLPAWRMRQRHSACVQRHCGSVEANHLANFSSGCSSLIAAETTTISGVTKLSRLNCVSTPAS